MEPAFANFVKKHDFLVCVDSDGCAMDTMDIKHIRCFGPCMVQEWGLGQWSQPILERWNEINLYSMTRGVNRFKGLAMALGEIDAQYTPIAGLELLQGWVASGTALSNDALATAAGKAIDVPGRTCLEKALAWSKAVNAGIDALPQELKRPFDGAKDGLAAAAAFADVAVVSSANRSAVLDEWQQHALLDHVDLVLAQDAGSKAHCIAQLLKFGYAPDHVLMVGDAPGDRDAAAQNGVYYYPILVRHEAESWAELRTAALAHLQDGSYAPYGQEKLAAFLHNLGG